MSDVAALFARDPLKLTREDFASIVADLRARRHQFNLGVRTTKAPKANEKAKKTIGDLDVGGFEL